MLSHFRVLEPFPPSTRVKFVPDNVTVSLPAPPRATSKRPAFPVSEALPMPVMVSFPAPPAMRSTPPTISAKLDVSTPEGRRSAPSVPFLSEEIAAPVENEATTGVNGCRGGLGRWSTNGHIPDAIAVQVAHRDGGAKVDVRDRTTEFHRGPGGDQGVEVGVRAESVAAANGRGWSLA